LARKLLFGDDLPYPRQIAVAVDRGEPPLAP